MVQRTKMIVLQSIVNCSLHLWQDAENRTVLVNLLQKKPAERKWFHLKYLAVIGVYTRFGSCLKRNTFRGSWMPRGVGLRKLEEKVVIHFVIGRRYDDTNPEIVKGT